jgi:hypothetical protein
VRGSIVAEYRSYGGADKKNSHKNSITRQTKMTTQNCPLCGKIEHLVYDDLGSEGMFYSCHEKQGGCGSTFRITPDGKCVDIF